MLTEELIQLTIYHAIREMLVAEGWLPDIMNFDVENPDDTVASNAAKAYQAAMKQIATTKGFCIELLPFSSNQAKGYKKVPRIVIDTLQFLPSFIGNDTQVNYELQGEYYIRTQSESLLSDLDFNVYAVGNDSKQMRIMNNLITQVLPKRGYIKKWNQQFLPSGNFFVKLLDAQKDDDLPEGVMERIFRYQIPEVPELPDRLLAGTIPRMVQIDWETIVKNKS